MFLKKIRVVEGDAIMNLQVSGRDNFVDGKPMKLSKNGSDVI